MRSWGLVLSIVCACGGGGGGGGGDDQPPDPGPWTIALESAVDPALLVVREGDGAWRMLAPGERSFVTAEPRYELFAVCVRSFAEIDDVFMLGVGRTVADERTVRINCRAVPTAESTVAIDVPVVGAGTAWLDRDNDASPTANWTFSTNPRPGMRRLLVVDADHANLRSESITTAATLAPIDAQAGVPLASYPLAITGMEPDDPALRYTNYFAFAGVSLVGKVAAGTGTTITAIPDALLTDDGDFQYVELGAGLGGVGHGVTLDARSTSQRSFVLPPKWRDLVVAERSATWTTLASFDTLAQVLQLDFTSATTQGYQVTQLSQRFLADRTGFVGDYTAVPGFDAAWASTVVDAAIYTYTFVEGGRPDDAVFTLNTVTNATRRRPEPVRAGLGRSRSADR